jgi:hypothetical protein
MFRELSERGAVWQQDGEVIEPERATARGGLHSRPGMKPNERAIASEGT